MDINLVTRQNYSLYLNESGYKPNDAHNFLQGWTAVDGVYQYPAGTEDIPVTSITVKEAQSYCAHNGKRLPHSYEW